jgi:hypothetical protein
MNARTVINLFSVSLGSLWKKGGGKGTLPLFFFLQEKNKKKERKDSAPLFAEQMHLGVNQVPSR